MRFPWDDLRVFLAISRSGSLNGAARALGVNHSTVFRRINGFEEALGVRLFDRLTSGYALTIAGEEMRATAERVEQEIDRLDRRISGQDLRLEGTLVVTTTDTLTENMLGPYLAAFKQAYPGITLDLVLDNQHINLSKRLADIAIRPTLSPPETLVGRRVATLAFAPYTAKRTVKKRPADLAAQDWLAVDDSLAHLAADKWFRKSLPDAHIAMRSNSLLGLLHGCEAGMGAALLPCFMGDPRAKLVRLGAPIPEAASALWLLTHEDLRHTARIRAFMDFMADALMAEVELLEGRAG